MTKRLLLYALVMMILLAVAWTVGRQADNDALLGQYSREISSWIQTQTEDARSWNAQKTGDQSEKPYTILIHNSDSLISWSNTKVIPNRRTLRNFATAPGKALWRLPLGWFAVVSEPTASGTRTTLVPVRYEASNLYPNTQVSLFPANRSISQNLQVVMDKTDWPVSIDGRENGWLKAAGPLQGGWMLWVKLSAWVLFFITLLSLLGQAAQGLSARFGAFVGAAMLFVVIGALFYFNVHSGWSQQQFGQLPLFARNFHNASLIGNSVGDWLINVGLLGYLMAFFHRNYRTESQASMPEGLRTVLAVLSSALAMLAIPLGMMAARQMIFNSAIDFDFSNILNIGVNGFLTLIGLIAFLAALFLFGHRLMLSVRNLGLARPKRWGILAAAALLVGVSSIFLHLDFVQVALFSLVYGALLDVFVHWEGNGFDWVVVWLLFFSGFSAILLYGFNSQNDRIIRDSYAAALVSERDTANTEPLLPAFLQNIQADSAQLSQILKPWPFKADIDDFRSRLNALALRDPYLFQQYQLKVAAFDQENQPVLLGQTLGYEEVVQQNWNAAQALPGNKNIRFFTGSDGKFRYLLRFSINRSVDAGQQVQVFIFLNHELPAPGRAFTQIFYNNPYKNLDKLSRFSFAIQKNGSILAEQGRGSLAALSARVPNGEVAEVHSGSPSRVDAVAKSADGKITAAVGHETGSWLKALYLFSIIFTLTSLLLLALAFFNSALNFLPEEYDFRLTAKGSLARRIHLWNVSLLAVSFLVIGILTYSHFRTVAREADKSDFNNKTEALQNNLEGPLLGIQDSSKTVSPRDLVKSMTAMTGSLGVDASLYAPAGDLLFCTQQDLVSLGMLPAKLDPALMASLSGGQQEMETEVHSGIYSYLMKYRPCRNGRGELLGFLGVPHPLHGETLGADVSDFIGVLASLYVFLLLIAFVVTYVLSRSIIRPLSMLSEKVQELKFTDKNDPLEYKGDNQDEVSELIEQYNAMVVKLEDSKTQLVRLEREGAWREMARQVAHDIKNPLTTMKLSMQQLERVSSNPEQAAAYLRKAITRLIEQIDSLAQIASEFSMFANLDIKHKNDVVINEVVESVHDLFSEQKNVKLELSLPADQYHIIGDKNHLIRVFNNLVINAIQAIPSDRDGKIQVSLTKKGKQSVVRISDNGGGIPPEIRDRVFEPNFTTKTSGSGLGLAICKKIIEAHDGNIRFETRENEGTDFFVEIPVV